jgi:hypothetical protein
MGLIATNGAGAGSTPDQSSGRRLRSWGDLLIMIMIIAAIPILIGLLGRGFLELVEIGWGLGQ